MLLMPNTANHMHHKFAIIDQSTIINGSYNWSDNAMANFENITVISNCPEQALKFIDEFRRLELIETDTIRQLQQKRICQEPHCGGQLFNLLVFSDRASQFYELTGDIVSYCSRCENKKVVQNAISENQLTILLNHNPDCKEEIYRWRIAVSDQMLKYMNNDIIIHAIGRVYRGLDGSDSDIVRTNIKWKNFFVGNDLPEVFDDESFGVAYDNRFEL